METKICNTCNRELPLSDFSLTRLGNRMAVCRDCVNEKRAQTRYNHAPVGGVKMPSFSDPDFDGKDPGEVWRQMCRAEKWLTSRGYTISLSGSYREVKIRQLKKG